jgi:hypothetical protein
MIQVSDYKRNGKYGLYFSRWVGLFSAIDLEGVNQVSLVASPLAVAGTF